MNRIIEKNDDLLKDCIGCGVCAEICPKKCINMSENKEGFMFPIVDEKECIQCGNCYKKCPQNKKNEGVEGTFYMAWNKDSKVLEKSSSGGVFTALANLF